MAIFEGDKSTIKLIEGQTIGQVLEATCRSQGLREALVFPEESLQLTFTQLAKEVEKLAAGFLLAGLKVGDVVALWGANHSQNILAVYACAKAGLIFTNLSHSINPESLGHHLNLVGAKALICFPTVKNGHCYDMIKSLEPAIEKSAKGKFEGKLIGSLKFVIIAEETNYNGTYTMQEIIELGSKDKNVAVQSLNEAASAINCDSNASIQLTAGTTGEPKAVSLSHFQLINSCLILAKRLNLDKMNEILCCPLLIFRGPVLCFGVLSAAITGTKTVFPSPLSLAPNIFSAIENQKCTCLLSNPIALHLMLRMPAASKFSLASLTTICLGGDHTTSEQLATFDKLSSVKTIISGVFLTEAGCMPIFCSKRDEIGIAKDGKVADHFQAKIVDFSGQTAQFNSPGELCIRPIGSSKFLGYYNQQKMTEKFYDSDGWIHTGNAGKMDKDGFITLMGHCDDIIFCDKKPIFPHAIEKHILMNPVVIGCQVVGVPDKAAGEKICACVVKKGGSSEDESLKQNLIKMCKDENLPEPHYVLFVEDFPRTPTKKVQKFKLKGIAAGLIKS